MENPLLERYSDLQIKVINDYWDTIRWTRSTGKVSEGIKSKELEFWSKYPAKTVIQALRTHIDKYPNIKEHYTRGIIRNLSKGQSQAPAPSSNNRYQKPVLPIVQSQGEPTVTDEEFAELMKMAQQMQDNKRK
ncbi:hypothetical protein V3851_23815 [Paenibacillus sp. M1]|uniref:Uncharacterized protein n=1 Tax=Paenibacillus haidiansis TaxID=1574488 RepID=A0ABU7VY66_9BACL